MTGQTMGGLELPFQMGRYKLLRRLDSGGMAEVFLAQQSGPEGFEKTVVVKTILPNLSTQADFVEMFVNEACIAAMFSHPNVISVYDFGLHPALGRYFIAMEYLEGLNLSRLRRNYLQQFEKVLPFTLSAQLVAWACAGLHYVHTLKSEDGPLNLVHQDVSPENLFVTVEGAVKVLDFGVAQTGLNQADASQVRGKIGFMSPERLRGALERRSDIWALGVTLYLLLTGRRPFLGENDNATARNILELPVPPLEEVPEELSRIVRRALEKVADERYQTAEEMQQDLMRWIETSQGALSRVELAELIRRLRGPAETLPPEPAPVPKVDDQTPSVANPTSVVAPASVSVSLSVDTSVLPAWKPIAAALMEVIPALVVWRFTYLWVPWLAPLLLTAMHTASLARCSTSPGGYLLNIGIHHRGSRVPLRRGLLRFLLGQGWFIAGSFVVPLLYASSPWAVEVGAIAGLAALASFINTLSSFGKRKQSQFDRFLGLSRVHSAPCRDSHASSSP